MVSSAGRRSIDQGDRVVPPVLKSLSVVVVGSVGSI